MVVLAFRSSWLRACGVMLLTLWGGACVWIFRHVAVEPIDRPADTLTVVSPVKAHLLDGSTVVYPRGVAVAHDSLHPLAGVATRYDAGLRPSAALPIPLDSVVGMEAFRTEVGYGATIMVSTLATVGTFFGALGLFVAIFGSCPTYYADSAGTPVLEAEGFSYSIAPLFEARDVDRLRVGVGPDGALRLEVRNEALESHYLNHLGLLEVTHGPAEVVLPDEWGRPLALHGWLQPAAVTDRSGRDLRALLGAADGRAFRTDGRIVDAAGVADLEDHIDVTLPRPPGAESVAVVLRARNSLLNTVLLYDVMLGARGARALDWVGSDLERVGPALELGNWYATRMGMRVGGDVYFVALLGALGHPDSVETARVRAVVGTYRGVVAAWLASRPGDAQLAAPETARLEQVWRALCAAIDSAVSAPVAARLRPMRDAGR